MATARDWLTTLRPASYRGVAFKVETDNLTTGRRLVVHEFPLKDQPYVEDMGRKANEITVTAYLASESVESEQRSLMRACEAGGAATLSLPMESLRAHCKEAKRDFSRDKLGYVAFHLSFVREGLGAGPYPIALLARLVEYGAGQLPAVLAASFVRDFDAIRQPSFVADSAVATITDMAVVLEAARATLPLAVAAAPALTLAIADLHADAPALIAVGSTGDRYAGRSFVAESITQLDAPLIERVADIVSGLRAGSEPAVAIPMLIDLARFGDGLDIIVPTSPARRREAQNRAALMTVLRAVALAHLAVAASERSYGDRGQAIGVRADVAALFDAELERIGDLTAAGLHAGVAEGLAPEDVAGAAVLGGIASGAINLWTALADLRGKIVQHLSAVIADLAPVAAVSAPTSMPSLWWSYRLYGTAARAEELSARNRVKHPSFMPREFEALVS